MQRIRGGGVAAPARGRHGAGGGAARWLGIGALASCLYVVGGASAEDAGTATAEVPDAGEQGDGQLTVGTKQAPPFAMRGEDGTWSGISIELWRDIAKAMGVQYEFREFDLQGLLEASERGTVDVGVAAMTITAARESKLDFSHPFFNTGLGIAVPPPGDAGVGAAVAKILSPTLLGYVGGLLALLLAVGVVMWLLERRHNPEQFQQGPKGVLDGMWWSAVTMTTVGYGDTAPSTLAGRLVALVWMFAAIIVISFFTAGIASSLTVSRLESVVQGPHDLPGVRVGTVGGASSERYLERMGVFPIAFDDVESGLMGIATDRIDAFVYDRPILQYVARQKLPGRVHVLDITFDPQTYGITMPSQSELREPINEALLKLRADETYWNELTRKYLGE